jgi:NDP-sugar pyrophosphorylase family protein
MRRRTINGYNVEAIILAGSRDFGRCPLATRLPTALWPIAGESALQHLANHLARERIRRVTICSNGDGSLLAKSIQVIKGLELKFLNEPLPAGPAGCIRDAVGCETDALLLVLPASIVRPPKIDALMEAHCDGQSDLTVVFNPSQRDGQSMGKAANIYVCSPGILEHIPKEGYFDIKEELIPEIHRAGKNVHAARLPYSVGHFRDRREYLRAIGDYLENTPKLNSDFVRRKRMNSQTVWLAGDANVDASARLYGPVAIMNGACISKSAIVIGPTIVGRNVIIREDSVVVTSALWDDAYVGPNCQIQQCIVDYGVVVSRNTVIEEESIPCKAEGVLQTSVNKTVVLMKNSATRLQHILQPRLDRIRCC